MLLEGIENGLLDIVIMIGESRYSNLRSRPFWTERILVAMPESHPLAQSERIHWTDLHGERFLLTERDPSPETRNMLLSKLWMPGHTPQIDMDDIGRDTILSAISLGGHILIVAESALGIQVPGVVFREVHESNGHIRIGFSGYWREDNDNAALHRFLEFIADRYSLSPLSGQHQSSHRPGREMS